MQQKVRRWTIRGLVAALAIIITVIGIDNLLEAKKPQAARGESAPDITSAVAYSPLSPSISAPKPQTNPRPDSSVLAMNLQDVEPAGGDIDEGVEDYEDYQPIEDSTLPEMLASIKTKNEELVTEDQFDDLLNVLGEGVWAYKVGSDELILANLLRAPYSVRPEATRYHLKLLNRFYKEKGETLPTDAEEIMRLLVSRSYDGEHGSGYKNLFNELSVQGSWIKFHSADKMPNSLDDHFSFLMRSGAQTLNNGMIILRPSVTYASPPETILEQSGKLTYVDIRLVASDSQGLRYSRYKRYYWSEPDNTWLPMEVVSMYTRQRKADMFL